MDLEAGFNVRNGQEDLEERCGASLVPLIVKITKPLNHVSWCALVEEHASTQTLLEEVLDLQVVRLPLVSQEHRADERPPGDQKVRWSGTRTLNSNDLASDFLADPVLQHAVSILQDDLLLEPHVVLMGREQGHLEFCIPHWQCDVTRDRPDGEDLLKQQVAVIKVSEAWAVFDAGEGREHDVAGVNHDAAAESVLAQAWLNAAGTTGRQCTASN